MRRSVCNLLLIAVAVSAAGCVLRGKSSSAKNPATPQTPQAPQVAARPAAPPEPLSIPQTQVHLPPQQPVNQAALAAADQPQVVELPEPPKAKPVARVPAARTTAIPKPDLPAGAPSTSGAPPAGATPPPERPIVQEQISPEEQKRIVDTMAGHRREIVQILEQAAARSGGRSDRTKIGRVRSFLKLSDEAAQRADLRQAEALSERALILARELLRGR